MALTPAHPPALVGRWIRLKRDGGCPPHLGVLTSCVPVPDYPGQWLWTLHSPTGPMIGGPHLPADVLTREHTADVRRARRQLTRRLSADRELLTSLIAHGDPVGVVGRSVARMEELQEILHEQLHI